MKSFCQICNQEAGSSYEYCPCQETKHWTHVGPCCCSQCRKNPRYRHGSNSEYQKNCCYCDNCQNHYHNKCTEQSSLVLEPYEAKSNEYDLSEEECLQEYKQEIQCLYGNYNFGIKRNFDINSSSRKANCERYGNRYSTYCNPNKKRHCTFANVCNESKDDIQAYNTRCLPENNGEIIEVPLNCNVEITQSKSDSNLNKKSDSSDILTKESFRSCSNCDSSQIQMMYRNNKQGFSKSTINQSSIQTITSKSSKPILHRVVTKDKYSQQKINSGYFEFISSTPSTNKISSEKEFANVPRQNSPSTTTHSLKQPVRYGYFEIKEKGCADNNKHQIKKVSFSELDKVPTKISKEVDTTHFKQSIMLDKCLSANIRHNGIKTSDKSMSANIIIKADMVTPSGILKVLQTTPKQPLRSRKIHEMQQSISIKSLTNFKPVLLRKPSVVKQKNSIQNVQRNLNIIKSLSEGSIKVCNQASAKKINNKDKVEARIDNALGYKNYLDKALDKMEIQIANKIEKALSTYAGISNKKQLVTIYNSAIENPIKMSSMNENSLKLKSSRNNVGTNPSYTMKALEEVIDLEEIEINTNNFEEYSPSLSHLNSKDNKVCSSNALSRDTKNTGNGYMSDNTENPLKKEISIKSDHIHSNSLDRQNKIINPNVSSEKFNDFKKGTTCKVAIVSGGNNYNGNFSDDLSRNSVNRKNLSSFSNKSQNRASQIGEQGHTFPRPYSRESLESNKQTSQKNISRNRMASRSCSNHSNLQHLSSSRQGVDGKTRGSHSRNIKFGKTSLGTIEEESRLSLNMIHEGQDNALPSQTDVPDSMASTKSLWSEENNGQCNNYSISDLNLQGSPKSSQCTGLRSKDNLNVKSNKSISDKNLSQSGYIRSSMYAHLKCPNHMIFPGDNSCCARQACRDCPKRRYYAHILQQSYNERRIKHYNEKPNEDQLYEYMLNVPLYNDKNTYLSHEHDQTYNMKLLNTISFVMFFVMFYGIFLYINTGLNNGKFP